jgi:nitroreductase
VDLAELIRSRRSIGLFNDAPVALELVHELLESAVYAPNHRLTEPWRFIILTGKGRERYAEVRRDMVLGFMKGQGEAERQQAAAGTYRKFMNVPLYLMVVMSKQANAEIDAEDYAACCCVIENFLLLAWDRGLGTTWKTFKNDTRLREYLELGENERVVGVVHVGYSAEEERAGQRKPAAERVTVFDGSSKLESTL